MNVIDHGMSLEEAITSPRFHHQWMPNVVRYEIGAISDEVAGELEAMGHQGLSGSRRTIGEANSVMFEEGFIDGMSDPRIFGGVAGY